MILVVIETELDISIERSVEVINTVLCIAKLLSESLKTITDIFK